MVIGKPSKLRTLSQSKVVVFIMRSWVLAIILGTIIFLLQNFRHEPYLLNLVDSSTLLVDYNTSRTSYHDLNADNESEVMVISNLSDYESCLLVRNFEGAVLEQWNFKGTYTIDLMKPILSDFDHDGKSEVSLVTLSGNKMLLNIVEPFDSLRFLVKNRLLDTVWTKYEEPYAYEHVAKPTDLNHDGSEEIIFSISSGYARQPRRVYAYDIKNDSLWLSPFSGSPVDDLTLFDLDQDGHIEITGWNNAPNNYFDEEIAFSDRNSWFFVFDEKLNYKRTPHKTGPKYSQVRPIPIFNKGVRDYFVYVQGHRDTIPFFDWYRIEHDYSLTKEEFPYKNVFSHSPEFLSSVSNNAEVFYNAYGESVFINESGKEFIRNDLPKRSNPLEIVNAGFGEQEFEYSFLIDGNSRSIAFFSSTGKKLCSINTVSFLSPPVINWIGRINGRYQFCLAGGKAMQWYEVYKNPWRYTQYGIWLLFILGCFGLIHLIRLSQIRE
jgi:hypothetical protein